ncbi:transposase [Oceanobacter sp. 2_MG-2023]|uniref:transposase n=1 Tax=Oceanobacter sp. 2_MG-2023 TaxID=3062619 RepID=UPI0027368FDF|nr:MULTISPECIES: transposase [unclassified Oceanobacter]MDP2609471.1 transposase [Oceanobacter sp. 1_MG-2023]MDP2612829.1 transposase [Oceanobacter sp. 2_MG-2023]
MQQGSPRSDTLLMFKMIFLRHYYSLPLKQVEYQMLDRLSFRRFLGLSPEDPVPDANTAWKYEELLVQKNLTDELFYSLLSHIEAHGYRPQGGQIIDVTLVEAPSEKPKSSRKKPAKRKKSPIPVTMTRHRRSLQNVLRPSSARPVEMQQPGRRNMARATSAIKITPASINSTNSFAATKRLRLRYMAGINSKS